jgi:MFS family permease
MTTEARQAATFRDVLAVPEFRTLSAAHIVSIAGDQLARVALAVLVFDRTGSPGLTALTYAITFLPAVLGGPLLGGLADRYPRRTVMVGCDVVRAALVAVMALPGIPLALMYPLVFGVVLLGVPFTAARSALLPQVLPEDRYVVGVGFTTIADQGAQLAGFAAGGAVVAATGTHTALAVDAGTFLVSGLLVRLGTTYRPAAGATHDGDGTAHSTTTDGRPVRGGSAAAGARLIWQSPQLRSLVALAWLAAFFTVPEGLAAPYADEIGAGPAAVGLLMAADPAGAVLGAVVLSRWVSPQRRLRLVGPLAVAAGLPLLACVARPGLPVSLLLWMVCGACSAYQIPVQARFARTVPDARRGQAVGLAASGLVAVQGAGILGAGVVAGRLGPTVTVAAAGGAGACLALVAAAAWSRASRAQRGALPTAQGAASDEVRPSSSTLCSPPPLPGSRAADRRLPVPPSLGGDRSEGGG